MQSNPPPPATRVTAAKGRKPVAAAHKASPAATVKRFVRWPGLILGPASLRALGVEAVSASSSSESRLLLAAGLALALLAVGEATFLALVGDRLGFRVTRRSLRGAR